MLVRLDDVAPAPWKNGGGVTRELLRVPQPGSGGGADDWLLRISVADIEADGPFSAFPGITRCFAVLEGAGVRLRWPDGSPPRVLTPAAASLRFDGGHPPACDLLDGPTRDLNVMVRTDAAAARLAPAAFGEEQRLDRTMAHGLFTRRAVRLHGASATPLDLSAGMLAWCEPGAGASPTWWIEAPLATTGDPQHTEAAAGAPPAWMIVLEAPARAIR